MNVALFGGTFDPVHQGHIEIARRAAERFGLDRVLLVPAGYPPHKTSAPVADYEHRYRMVELACGDDPRLAAARHEAPAKGEPEPSYTVITLRKIRSQLHPQDRLFFLIGADAFADIEEWYRWEEVVQLTEFIVVARPGWVPANNKQIPNSRIHSLRDVELPISSTEIRERLARGDEVDDWLPATVAAYIRAQGLYRPIAGR